MASLERPGDMQYPEDGFAAQQLLTAAQRAAKLLRGVKVAIRGKKVPMSLLVDLGLEAVQWRMDAKEVASIAEAKAGMRRLYMERAATITEHWGNSLDQVRDGTTRAALAHRVDVERDLLASLSELKEEVTRLATTRVKLNDFIDESIEKGYASIEDTSSAFPAPAGPNAKLLY